MSDSTRLGFMAAFAVSGSLVLIARQVHKRMLSDFLKKIEFELGGSKMRYQSKKKVRLAEPSSNNQEYRKKHRITSKGGDQFSELEDATELQSSIVGGSLLDGMPVNRQLLYKGIIQYKALKGCNAST
ncbi:hypothetical protein K2173_024142 [Erythroxylum novogranatense]|uniref:Uncharacterized protein n=1 Tax=Erythroxylum novogranatense TaxID=1862640 RepID=A0AAV8UER5_9ROSI|nr:hypothetical protein K2173_024142 [Erythroxylum novogranatense]